MTAFDWPDRQAAAVTLKFDDGLESHRSELAPLLESFGLRGTFYLCPAGTREEWLERASRWRPLLDAGHEIGNHTMTHPAPVALIGEPAPHSYEQMTPQVYRDDVLEAHRRLELAFGPRQWSFCYPCYQTWVGVGVNRQSVVPFIARHFAAACTGGEISKPYNLPRHCDLHALMTLHAEGLTGSDLIARVESARRMNRWMILTFHGIDEGHLAVGRNDLEELLAYLGRNRNSIWTAPVINVALHVRSIRRAP